MWENFHKIVLSLLAIFLALSLFIWPNKWKGIFQAGNTGGYEQNDELKRINDQLSSERKILSEKISKDSLLIIEKDRKILEFDNKISKVDNSITIQKQNIDKMNIDIDESKKIIDKIRSSPSTKTGDDLIISVKNRLK